MVLGRALQGLPGFRVCCLLHSGLLPSPVVPCGAPWRPVAGHPQALPRDGLRVALGWSLGTGVLRGPLSCQSESLNAEAGMLEPQISELSCGLWHWLWTWMLRTVNSPGLPQALHL